MAARSAPFSLLWSMTSAINLLHLMGIGLAITSALELGIGGYVRPGNALECSTCLHLQRGTMTVSCNIEFSNLCRLWKAVVGSGISAESLFGSRRILRG